MLRLWQGATENTVAVKNLLEDLVAALMTLKGAGGQLISQRIHVA